MLLKNTNRLLNMQINSNFKKYYFHGGASFELISAWKQNTMICTRGLTHHHRQSWCLINCFWIFWYKEILKLYVSSEIYFVPLFGSKPEWRVSLIYPGTHRFFLDGKMHLKSIKYLWFSHRFCLHQYWLSIPNNAHLWCTFIVRVERRRCLNQK